MGHHYIGSKFCGSVVLFVGSLAPWFDGSIGLLARWFDCIVGSLVRLDRWLLGSMVRLDSWLVGSMVRLGFMVLWFDGSMVRSTH